jgi:ABC-type antimicrobial peptide transport system permease subunit
LTVLGVCIGVGAFSCSVAVGEGPSSQIDEQIHSLGNSMIRIEAGNRNVNGVRTGTHGTKSLVLSDAKAIEEQILLVRNVTINPRAALCARTVRRVRHALRAGRGGSPRLTRKDGGAS